jgi:hypothetical protein
MPVIVYQSLNSNSSNSHDVSASNIQHFTRMTQKHSVQQGSENWALVYPTSHSLPSHAALYGPPQLFSTSTSSDYSTKGQIDDTDYQYMAYEKMRQMQQAQYREFGVNCDLMVIGELDSSNSDWDMMSDHAGTLIGSTSSSKTCQCFSVHSNHSGVGIIAEGTSWVAVRCVDVIALFVHVPNDIAGSTSKVQGYYEEIHGIVSTTKGGGLIDVVMGDTNQKSAGVTPTALTDAIGVRFEDAYTEKEIEMADAFGRKSGGTNAKGTAKYDVAVYNTKTVKAVKAVYLSQFTPIGGSVAAVTDHMAICAQVSK